MKYKIGDKVKIISKEKLISIVSEKEFNKLIDGLLFSVGEAPFFTLEMLEYCGKIFTIKEYLLSKSYPSSDDYYLLVGCPSWSWADWMFEDVVDENVK